MAEYTLRGIGSPIGVAGYQMTRRLPKELQEMLPSTTELEEQLSKEEGSSYNLGGQNQHLCLG